MAQPSRQCTIVLLTNVSASASARGDGICICVSHPPRASELARMRHAGVLNHKYTGENAMRAAGVPYTVVRATGLTSEVPDI